MAMRKIDKSPLVDPHSEEETAVSPGFDEIGRDEGLRMLELHAQQEFGISANEFIQRWDNRDFPQDPDSLENWWRVSLLIPFAIQPD